MQNQENVQNFDIKFLVSEFGKSEQGYSNIIKKYYTRPIYITSIEKKKGYIWNNERKLYEEYSFEMVINDFSDLLRKCIKCLKTKTQNDELLEDDDKEKKNKKYSKIEASFGSSTIMRNVHTFILSNFLNKDIEFKMNNNENIIPVKNGKLIDLNTGNIRDRTDKDYFTYEKDFEYLGNDLSKTPHTDKFFEDICCGNQEKKEFLKLVMGSSITTYTKMKCFFILYGKKGNNGKSTLMETLGKIFSEQYLALPHDLIYSDNVEKVDDTQFGTLIGKTIGTSIEPEHKYINEPIIKLLTGTDSVSARLRYSDARTYEPKIKIFILLNNILRIGNTDILKKRTRVLNFDAEFVQNPLRTNPYQYKADAEISSKFLTIWKNDFFTYIVNCAIQFLNSNNKMLNPPRIVQKETDDYFYQSDYFGQGLNETFEITKNLGDKVLRSELTSNYEAYCLEKEKPYNRKKFLEYLEQQLGEAKKTSGLNYDGDRVEGDYFFKGIRYKPCNKSIPNELEQQPSINEKTELLNIELAEMNNKLIIENEKLQKENLRQLQENKRLLDIIAKLQSNNNVVEDSDDDFDESELLMQWNKC
jgi:phage/plasmid-associated DNA primase